MILTIYSDPDFLEHHGVKGMKWGVRRYQDYNGRKIGTTNKPKWGNKKYQNKKGRSNK